MAHSVTIAAGKYAVNLPNGFAYDAGTTVTLTDDQYGILNQALIPTYVIDNGPVATGGDAVVTQGAAVSAIATADGSDPTTTQALANATKAKVNALIAALTGSGKPLHT